MDMTKRVQQFFKAYVNEGLEKMEDPVIMVKQYMRDVNVEIKRMTQLIEKKQELSETLRKDAEQLKETIAKREKQAKIALENEDEELAKKLLNNKHDAYEQKNRYDALFERNEEQLVEQKAELEQLLVKYQKLKERKLDLLLRMEAVESKRHVEQLEKQGIRRSQIQEDPFERWEERITEMERHQGKTHKHETFQVNQLVMDELKQLKAKLNEQRL
ncbi:PspA/IM30 family protein [Halalkalibacter sp. AB-rgal2]|uniref:PspA/IM30 family protein n=1 Tax=Halalkalibacter sp. AB-rgal2 TaxID=3242695 RepID=UPI00359D0A53